MAATAGASVPTWLDPEPDETVWVRASPSKSLILVGVALGVVILVAVSVIVGALGHRLVGRVLSAGMLVTLVALLIGPIWYAGRREYVLTSRRIIDRAALPWREGTQLAVDDVDQVSLEQSRWEGWIGVGDVRFIPHDDTGDLRFAYLEDPHLVFEQVSERLAGD